MNSKLQGMLGMARRANKVSLGHDAADSSLKENKAKLVLLSSDASDRLKNEMEQSSLRYHSKCIVLDCDMKQLGAILGAKLSAVISINDTGFAQRIEELTREE